MRTKTLTTEAQRSHREPQRGSANAPRFILQQPGRPGNPKLVLRRACHYTLSAACRRNQLGAVSLNRSKTMSSLSGFSRVAATTLVCALACSLVMAQDIAGGAGVLLASADVEAKLGKGIFTPAQNKPHVNKTLEKKPIARSVRSAHPRANTAGNRSGNTGTTGNTGSSGNRSGAGTRPAMDAEAYTKQGDDFFDAGKYDQAAQSYQQAIKLRADYADAYLNLGETYFNLVRLDEAITADNQAIFRKPDFAEAYKALRLAQFRKNNA